MSEAYKKQLEQQLWNIADTLRGKMDADAFRDYILGFIFYKYLSEKMCLYADELLKDDDIAYRDIQKGTLEAEDYLPRVKRVKKEALEKLGYFLEPWELFRVIAAEGRKKDAFILDSLQAILNNIEQSTLGTPSQDDFDKLFEDLNLSSSKLGKTDSAKNALIAKVLGYLDEIDFQLRDTEQDLLGDAYEYLIARFASGAGKKAGEFYTPPNKSQRSCPKSSRRAEKSSYRCTTPLVVQGLCCCGWPRKSRKSMPFTVKSSTGRPTTWPA